MNRFPAFLTLIPASMVFAAGCCPPGYMSSMENGETGEKKSHRLNLVQFDAGTRYTDSYYDADGNKQSLFGDGSERLNYFKASYTRQILGGIDVLDSRFALKGKTWIDYASLSSEYSFNSTTSEQSGSGFRSTGIEAEFSTYELSGANIISRVITGYQASLAPDPEPSNPDKQEFSSRQNALYFGTIWGAKLEQVRLNAQIFYGITAEREDNGNTYDGGDYLALAGGGSYSIRLDQTMELIPSLHVNYLSHGETASNGTTNPNSDGYLLSLTPAVDLRLRDCGLLFRLAYGYDEEFQRTPVGGIPLAGKNFPVPGGFTASLNVQYRFE